MATIITKNSSTASSVPLNTQLVQGELAVNVTDKRLFTENASGTVVELGTNPSTLVTSNTFLAFGRGNTEDMRLTSTGLGIGTSSPAQKLTVLGDNNQIGINTTGAYSSLYFYSSGTQKGGLYYTVSSEDFTLINNGTTGKLLFANNGAVRATLDSSGNLGLGVTPSAWNTYAAFQMSGGSLASYSDGSSNNQFTSQSNAYYATGWKYKNSGTATQYVQYAGQHIWNTAPSGTAGNAITFTQAMTLDASGKLLVGATGTAYGAVNVQALSSGTSLWSVNDPTLNWSQMYFGGALNSAYTFVRGDGRATGYLAFGTNDTERARIDSSGNLLVGTTTASGKLTVESTGSTQGWITHNNSGGQAILINGVSTAGTGWRFLTGVSSNTTVTNFIVYGNGNVQNTNNSYGAISDAKLKDIIGAAPSYWEKFKQYQFVNYTLKSDEAKTKLLGLVAQQAQQVCPGVVEEAPDLDAEGNDLGTTTMGVKYSVVTLQAEVVLQEAQARIESLEAIIEQLKADVAALKAAA